MIYFGEAVKEKLKNIVEDNYYIITDFDRTLTAGDTISTWGALSESGMMPTRYAEDRQALYDKYRAYEIDLTLDEKTKCAYMLEWWEKHRALFFEYGVPKNIFEQVGCNNSLFRYRKGVKKFLALMNSKDIPVLIFSAGVGDIISSSMHNNGILFENVQIVSNFMQYDECTVSGVEGTVIHSLNKNEESIGADFAEKIVGKSYVFVFGDGIDDVRMIPKHKENRSIKIGFCETNEKESLQKYKEVFDIVCTNNTSFEELLRSLKEQYGFCF